MHLFLDWLILTIRLSSWLLLVLRLLFSLCQRDGRVILSILGKMTVLGILIHVVDITKIDFASNHLGAAFNDLGKIFGQSFRIEKLGSLISNTSRLPETLMAILAFSPTDILIQLEL